MPEHYSVLEPWAYEGIYRPCLAAASGRLNAWHFRRPAGSLSMETLVTRLRRGLKRKSTTEVRAALQRMKDAGGRMRTSTTPARRYKRRCELNNIRDKMNLMCLQQQVPAHHTTLGTLPLPSRQQRLMDHVSAQLQGGVQEHYENVRTFLQTCREKGVYLKASKAQMLKESLKFLGHTLSSEGCRPQHDKVAAVRDWPALENATHVDAVCHGSGCVFREIPKHEGEEMLPDFRALGLDPDRYFTHKFVSEFYCKLQVSDTWLRSRLIDDASAVCRVHMPTPNDL
eukprot:gene30705-biopygen32046